jgi:hypothetical protein
MLRLVVLVRTGVSGERSASIIRVTRIGGLGTIQAVTSKRWLQVTTNVVPSSPILVTLMMKAPRSSKTSVLSRTTRRKITEDIILLSHCSENFKSYVHVVAFTIILTWIPVLPLQQKYLVSHFAYYLMLVLNSTKVQVLTKIILTLPLLLISTSDATKMATKPIIPRGFAATLALLWAYSST